MTEPVRPRLFVVASAPDTAGGPIVESLAACGVPPASDPVRAALDELAGVLAASASDDSSWAPAVDGPTAQLGATPAALRPSLHRVTAALGHALAAQPSPGATTYRVPAVGEWLATLLRAIAHAGALPSTIVAWSDPSAIAAAASGPARALALARWELVLHRVLHASAEQACVVLPPTGTSGIAAKLAEYVGARERPRHEPGAGKVADSSATTPSRGDSSPGRHADVLASQEALASILLALEGPHVELGSALHALPNPSVWTIAIDDAERRARRAAADAVTAWEAVHERGQHAEVLWGALWQTSTDLAALVDDALTLERRLGEGLDVDADAAAVSTSSETGP